MSENKQNRFSGSGPHSRRNGVISARPAPPEMSGSEYRLWYDFIRKKCGQAFPETRRRYLLRRLWERMQAHTISTYGDYYHFIAFNRNGEREWQILLELLLNNETSFFRHQPSFDALSHHVLPDLRRAKEEQGDRSLNLWSAGCSTGQEPYSLAMAIREAVARNPQPAEQGGWGGIRPRIFGSDICTKALEKARQGRYKAHELRILPKYYRQQYLQQVTEGRQTSYQVQEEIRSMVDFGVLHLHDPRDFRLPAQDVIFCQNVLIYFEPEDRLQIVRRLCTQLQPGGYLFLGPAEIVGLRLPELRLLHLQDVLLYQKHP